MTTAQTIRRPIIPAEWYQPSILGSVGFILYVLALYAVPASLSYLVATSVDPLILKIVLIIPLTIIAGYGTQMLGFIGHEGFHLSLHPNKLVSALIGMFFASGVIGYFEIGAMMRHWMHHRYTNQPSDPEIHIQASLKTWWQRLFLARLYLNLYDIKTVVNTALGRPCSFPYIMPFKFSTAQKLCWFNLGFSLFWMSIYLGITFYAPIIGLVSIALPMVAALIVVPVSVPLSVNPVNVPKLVILVCAAVLKFPVRISLNIKPLV